MTSKLYVSLFKPSFPKPPDAKFPNTKGRSPTLRNPSVLIITPNQAWIDQHGLPAYNAAMDAFATNKLPAPQLQDNNSRCIFRFQGIHDLLTVHDGGLAPNTLHIGPSFHALVPHAQLEPIGTAWFLEKMGPRQYSFGPVDHFFLCT